MMTDAERHRWTEHLRTIVLEPGQYALLEVYGIDDPAALLENAPEGLRGRLVLVEGPVHVLDPQTGHPSRRKEVNRMSDTTTKPIQTFTYEVEIRVHEEPALDGYDLRHLPDVIAEAVLDAVIDWGGGGFSVTVGRSDV